MAAVDINPQFGTELKDGFKIVNTWVSGRIGFLEDVSQYYRERSAIEKEYSVKLIALAKKYYEKKTKKSASLSVGDSPTVTPGSLESASMTTWSVQLSTLEARAAEHENFSNELINNLAEPVKHLTARCEDIRKQHADYAAKLEKERDGSFADLKKLKGKYDGVCQDVESRRKKVDAASYEARKSKAENAFQQQSSDMHNAKNTYIIGINVTNKQKERYYNEYVPDLLDSLQDLSESQTSKLNILWSSAATLETNMLGRSKEHVEHLSSEIPRNKPVLDSMMFVRHNAANWTEPFNFAFEPSPVWLDDDRMVNTGPAKVFLQNILTRSKSQLHELRGQVDTQRREWEAAKLVKQRIRDGTDKRDEVEVTRSAFHVLERFHELERSKITAEIEVSTILRTVGDVTVGARSHNFRSQTFKIPTNCDLCGERIWGLSAKGFDCRDCGFTCHSKCEMKVPADCPGEQDKEERKTLKTARQSATKSIQPTDDDPSDRHDGMLALARTETTGSLNTLSSGYAASANRSVSGMTQPLPGDAAEDHGPKKPSPMRPRVLAPPPTLYIGNGSSNGTSSKPREKRAKMLYAYEARAAGELTIGDGEEVVIVEPDDGSGWSKVRAGSKEGLVPAAYMEVVAPTSPFVSDLERERERPGSTYSASSGSLAGSIANSINANPGGKKKGPAVAPKRGGKKLKQVVALYDYEARTVTEHSMREGEQFVLVNPDGGDGWLDIEKGGVVKSVPSSYVQNA